MKKIGDCIDFIIGKAYFGVCTNCLLAVVEEQISPIALHGLSTLLSHRAHTDPKIASSLLEAVFVTIKNAFKTVVIKN